MRISIILRAMVLLSLGAALASPAALASQSRDEGRAMYNSLRTMALRTSAADLGFHGSGVEPMIFGVVMDMDIDGETATLVSFETGDASLYLSTGGGMIGGGAH